MQPEPQGELTAAGLRLLAVLRVCRARKLPVECNGYSYKWIRINKKPTMRIQIEAGGGTVYFRVYTSDYGSGSFQKLANIFEDEPHANRIVKHNGLMQRDIALITQILTSESKS